MILHEKYVLTINEVSDLIRIPLSTCKKLASKVDVDFPRSIKIGKHRRWLASDVLAFLQGDPGAKA